MSRALRLALVLAPIVSGCIIYEERYHKSDCDGCTTDPGEPPPPPPPSGTTSTDTTPAGPELTDDVALTPNEAYPGDSLLATLVPTGPGVDLTTVTTLTFERDVTITDSIVRPDEIILLLDVDPAAAPGDVLVFMTTEGGGAYLLAEPFHLLASGTTSPGDSGADTGATTGDTGGGGIVTPPADTASDTGQP